MRCPVLTHIKTKLFSWKYIDNVSLPRVKILNFPEFFIKQKKQQLAAFTVDCNTILCKLYEHPRLRNSLQSILCVNMLTFKFISSKWIKKISSVNACFLYALS